MDSSIIETLLRVFFSDPDYSVLLAQMAPAVSANSERIAQQFYEKLLDGGRSSPFLSLDMVRSRLISTMREWIDGLFLIRKAEEVPHYITQQQFIGEMHTQLNIPMQLVVEGAILIKRELDRCILSIPWSGSEKMVLAREGMHAVFDLSLAAIGQSYRPENSDRRKNPPAPSRTVPGHELAVECEKIKTALLEWFGQVLMVLRRSNFNRSSFPDIYQSDVVRWIARQGPLLFPGRIELDILWDNIQKLDSFIVEIVAAQPSRQHLNELTRQMNIRIGHSNWLLSMLARDVLEREPFTRLLPPEHLPVVLRHQTEYSLQSRQPYALLLMEILRAGKTGGEPEQFLDNRAIESITETLRQHIRSTDCLFHIKRGKFLVLLSNCKKPDARRVAEQLRKEVEETELFDPASADSNVIRAMVSIGIAAYEGHPDWRQMLRCATEALSRTKHEELKAL